MTLVLDKPYKFVPPCRGKGWPSFIQWTNLYSVYLNRHDGIVSHECRGVDLLKESLRAGHGILMCPNHCRTADPLCMGWLSRESGSHVYGMASWHLFNESWLRRWALPKIGAFSINREGMDKQAISLSIEVLETAERPLVIFPEGATTRTNDYLHALLDGVTFIARTAAKRRAKSTPGGRVVMHPIGIKYVFRGDIQLAADGVLTDIEQRLSWQPQRELPLLDRLRKVGSGLLALKEVEYLGTPQPGTLAERISRLIEALLVPLEEQWLGQRQSGAVIPRVKAVRMRITPEMIQGELPGEEQERRFKHLAALELAQQLNTYPPDYVASRPSADRVLETLERFEEHLTGKARRHGNIHVILEVGEPIDVPPERERGADVDPLMVSLEQGMRRLLDRLSLESALVKES